MKSDDPDRPWYSLIEDNGDPDFPDDTLIEITGHREDGFIQVTYYSSVMGDWMTSGDPSHWRPVKSET